jgi:hypothetical protein
VEIGGKNPQISCNTGVKAENFGQNEIEVGGTGNIFMYSVFIDD